MRPAVVLVMAKAPVAGRVKTRLGADTGMELAAELAASALLDTLRACVRAYGSERCHLALAGDLGEAARRQELETAIRSWTVHAQRGQGLAARLRHAHQDVADLTGAPVVQIGMDTPHVRAATLRDAAARLTGRRAAVLGPALDGGWWLLGAGSPALVEHLGDVPMSTPQTHAHTRRALRRAGAAVTGAVAMRDVDTVADAAVVAARPTGTRFARTWQLARGAAR